MRQMAPRFLHLTYCTLVHQTITDLMGRDTSARFNFIMQHATEADELDV